MMPICPAGLCVIIGEDGEQVGIPTMISFAAIIFKDDIYTPWLGQLAKLAFLGSAVHQFVFTVVSTLPFAVGQVQGPFLTLIFTFPSIKT